MGLGYHVPFPHSYHTCPTSSAIVRVHLFYLYYHHKRDSVNYKLLSSLAKNWITLYMWGFNNILFHMNNVMLVHWLNGNKGKHQQKIQSPGISFHSIFPLKIFKGLGTDPFKDNAMNVLLVVHNVKVFFKIWCFCHSNTLIQWSSKES